MFCLFLKRKERKQAFPAVILPQLRRRGHARGPTQKPHGCARRHRSRQTHRRGSPTLGTAATGWEAQETPGSPRNPPGTRSPPAAPIRSRLRAPMPAAAQGSSKSPRERLPHSGGTQSVRAPTGAASALTLRFGVSRRQGCGIPGEEPSEGPSGGPRLRGAGRRQRPWRVTCRG